MSEKPGLQALPVDKPRSDSADSLDAHDHALEKKVRRKCDLHLVPILFLLFLCAFVDRINIGNAKIQGLTKDLKMKGEDYNIALFMFFIPYILLEVPSNMILKKLRPSVWLSAIMFCWGVITICQGVTQSFAGLVVCRVLLGVFESGFFPGCIYLLSMYYKRYELQLRVNLFFSASILAGAFSGLLAYAIAHMAGIAGYSGWRWIFILEGLFTCVVAFVSFWIIPDWPEAARFLTTKERDILIHRLAVDAADAKMSRWDKKAANRVFSDPKIYLGILMYLGIVNTGYATSFFTPTILTQLGWKSIHAQVMSIPIYIVATALALTTAVVTDRLKHRFGAIIIGCCIATAGYAILLNMRHIHVGVRYFALYLITGGGYIAQPVTIVWLSNNMGGHYKRGMLPESWLATQLTREAGISSAMQIGIGNCGGLIASNIFLERQAPHYPLGFGLSLGLVWLCGFSGIAMFFLLRAENKARDAGKRDYLNNLPADELDNLGDGHPKFRFSY